MIEKITMKNVASYDGIGVVLKELDRVNLIYGGNGTGKTTISNFINSIASGIPENKYVDCSIVRPDNDEAQILVYNRKFREENLKKGTLPGVFVLSKEANENKQQISDVEQNMAEIESNIVSKSSEIDKINSELENQKATFQTEVGKPIVDIIKAIYEDAAKGFIRGADDKRLEKIVRCYNELQQSKPFSEEELRHRIEIVSQRLTDEIPLIAMPDFTEILQIEQDPIWQKVIAGSTELELGRLLNQLHHSDWVNNGLKYIQEDSDVCPFCQQHTLDGNLKQRLANLFDRQYDEDVSYVKNCTERYKNLTDELVQSVNELLLNATYLNFLKDTDLEKQLKQIQSDFKSISLQMSQKELAVSTPMTLGSSNQNLQVLQAQLEHINVAIEKQNELIRQRTDIARSLVDDVWRFVVHNHLKEIRSFIGEKQTKSSKQTALHKELQTLVDVKSEKEKELGELQSNSYNTQEAANYINEALRSHGFKSFWIEPGKENDTYQLSRPKGGDASQTLSEGEETLITFLYFMQMVKGKSAQDTQLNRKIVVVDDPISSLDSSVMSLISREIKDLIFDIGNINNTKPNARYKQQYPVDQLIVLTHNIYFHKSISLGPIAGAKKEEEKKKFFMLVKSVQSGYTCLETQNPKLVESEYVMLWNVLRNAVSALKKCEDESTIATDYKYTIQNTMRRIYDSFFRVTCNMRDNDIASIFKNKAGEKKESDFRDFTEWINCGSHSADFEGMIALPSKQDFEKYLGLFKELFEVTGNAGQYGQMMGTLN